MHSSRAQSENHGNSPDSQASISAFMAARFPRGSVERVLLVTPPDGESELFRIATAQRRRYPNYPPYGLAVLATRLRAQGLRVEILNLNHQVLEAAHATSNEQAFDFDRVWQQQLDDAMARVTPDLVGVTCMFTMTHVSLRRVCRHLEGFSVPIAIGGVHVTNDVDRVLDDIPSVSFAFKREADLALPRMIAAVGDPASHTTLGQLVLNDAVAGFRMHLDADLQPEARDLDVIPAYDLISIGDLSRVGVIGNFHGFKPAGTRFATCLSNRGCRAQCTFCSVRNFNGKAVRQRSVESVLDELQLLREVHGVEHITWLDDDLLKDHPRALALFDGMVARGLGLTWDATNGVIAASCTDEMVSAMSQSGCIALNIGMESGNPEILRQIRKPGTVKNFLAAAEVLRRYEEIHARVFLMLGFPGETLAKINDTISVAREMDLDWCGITVLQPLPNTPIYNAMVEQGLVEPVGSGQTRFNSGGYGKQDQVDMGVRMASSNFEEAFAAIPMDAVPSADQLDDIWFFMNYHLNFHRLFSESRPSKLEQQRMNLTTLSDVISPEHGFALYFTGFLQHRMRGRVEQSVIDRLEHQLARSGYWRDRFRAFGLSLRDLRQGDFANKEIPRLLPGRVPELEASFDRR